MKTKRRKIFSFLLVCIFPKATCHLLTHLPNWLRVLIHPSSISNWDCWTGLGNTASTLFSNLCPPSSLRQTRRNLFFHPASLGNRIKGGFKHTIMCCSCNLRNYKWPGTPQKRTYPQFFKKETIFTRKIFWFSLFVMLMLPKKMHMYVGI